MCTSVPYEVVRDPNLPELNVEDSRSAPKTTNGLRDKPQPYPNPFSPPTPLQIWLDHRDSVKLTFYDIDDNPVTRTYEATLDSGSYRIRLPAIKWSRYTFRVAIGKNVKASKVFAGE